MKKIFNLLALAVLALAAQSCLHDDTELFDKSAAERIQESVDDTKALLASSPNGWLMHYYTGEDYTNGGYNMLMRFTESTAYISSDIAPADSVSHSSWDVKKDQGVVISIDTYNEILHSLANPSTSAIDGQEADYEFVVLRATEDSIFVRGKKWKNKMVMTRLADDFSWTDYLQKTRDVLGALKSRYKTDDATLVKFSTGSRHLYFGDDATGKPFYATPEGLTIVDSPYELGSKAVEKIAVNAETGDVSIDGVGSLTYAPSLSESFVGTGEWYFDGSMMSDRVKAYFQEAVDGSASLGETISYMVLYAYGSDWYFEFATGSNTGLFVVNATVVDDEHVNIKFTGSCNSAGLSYYNSYGYNYVVYILGSFAGTTWALSTDNVDSPSWIRFENVDNDTEYFYMYPPENAPANPF